jgi:outer membrane protein OmpA-like peptidoglycan-associated protein
MKITSHLLNLSLIAVIAITSGCASQPQLTQEQILNQNQKVASLNAALKQAKANDAELLAAESYTRASNSLDRAMTAASNNSVEVANAEATAGLKSIDKLNRDIRITRETLAEVLQARDRAYKAGANTLQSNKFAELDAQLKRTATMIEDGNIEKAKKRRPELLADYQQIQLVALKQNTMNLAKTALADAKQQRATKYAPKTLAQAEEEMALAVKILDADRTQTGKANIHAKKAKSLAEQSAAITETVKDFDRRDYTMEDIVLWHQQHLLSINEPLGEQLPLNESSDKVVLSLRNAITKVVNERNMTRSQLQEAEQQSQAQLQSAEKRIAGLQTASQLAKQKEQAEQQKFVAIQGMFTEGEANVYRQRQNVLISAHGFQFPSGQSEIQANNFPLMNKIIRAIKTFPKAYIEVAGHTDSMGDDLSNQLLSETRAEKVAKFLNEVGEISSSRIMSRGFGETRPVATNETSEGRAENRRVEIKIINE